MATADYSWPIVREPYAGAWQQKFSINTDTAASFHADFACKTLIARDIAKLRLEAGREGRRRHLVGDRPIRHFAGAAAAERLPDA